MFEWNEQIAFGSFRGYRGGDWLIVAGALAAGWTEGRTPTIGYDGLGFRVAPEPAQALLALTGALVLAMARRRTGGHGR